MFFPLQRLCRKNTVLHGAICLLSFSPVCVEVFATIDQSFSACEVGCGQETLTDWQAPTWLYAQLYQTTVLKKLWNWDGVIPEQGTETSEQV